MNNPLVSVIIPNYCHSKFLDQRIQTVLNQTYQNFEVIILDDASPDEGASKSVIEKYRENEHISKIIYNENNSGSTFLQWKKGFQLAQGELIWIAESDDYCEPTILSTLVNSFLLHDNLSFAFCTSNIVDNDNKLILGWHDKAEEIPHKLFDGVDFIKKHLMLDNSVYNASAIVFKKNIALNIDNAYMSYKAAGDHLFWILLAEEGQVFHNSEKLNYFRQHQNKVTNTKAADGTQNRELHRTVNYLRSKGYVRLWDEFAIADFYINKTLYQTAYNDPKIVAELLKQWNCHKLFNKFTLPIVRFLLKIHNS